jgi:hypothetical protein
VSLDPELAAHAVATASGAIVTLDSDAKVPQGNRHER